MADVMTDKAGAEIQSLPAIFGFESYALRRDHSQWRLSWLIRPGLEIVLHFVSIEIFFVGRNASQIDHFSSINFKRSGFKGSEAQELNFGINPYFKFLNSYDF
jgi:hypothetical protein